MSALLTYDISVYYISFNVHDISILQKNCQLIVTQMLLNIKNG